MRDGTVRRSQRLVERPLLPIRDRRVVMTLRDALPQASALEGGSGDVPGADRLRVASPQVTDDSQIVGAATGGGRIPVPAGREECLREVVRRLVDPTAHQSDSAPRIEGVTLDRMLVPLARPIQRDIQPPHAFLVMPEPRLRRPVHQREGR